MKDFFDYYKILKIEYGADKKAIVSGWGKILIEVGPNFNKDPEATEKFHLAQKAKKILLDPVDSIIYNLYYNTYYFSKTLNAITKEVNKNSEEAVNSIGKNFQQSF